MINTHTTGELEITTPSQYKIDFEKVNGLEDVILILKELNITFTFHSNATGNELLNRGLLKEVK